MSQSLLLLITLVPLLIFVVVDFYSGLKSGILAAILTAAGTALAVWWLLGEFDWESWFIVAVMAFAGWLSVKKNNPVMFKLQPVITGSAVVIYLAWMQFFDTPFLLKSWPKLQSMLPSEQVILLDTSEGQKFLSDMTLYYMFWTLLHVVFVGWAAVKKSNKYWIIVKALGVPLILLGSFLTIFFRQALGF